MASRAIHVRSSIQGRALGRQGARVLRRFVPGMLLCLVVAAVAWLAALGESALLGRAWLEWLVLAIILGAGLRTAWRPPRAFDPGIAFAAKRLLEIAVVLLGASLDAASLRQSGLALLLGIALVVFLALALGYGLGRLLGLPHRLAVLVAAGNAICGNSAIAAIAPVLGADGEEVTASIAFTAVLGVLVVLVLPPLMALLQLSQLQYGVLAGLTVYAVPQVLAATAPISALSVQIGTLVKLVRVLMLGPVILMIACLAGSGKGMGAARRRPAGAKLLPWFILGFLGMAALRSLGLLPELARSGMALTATFLTILSMAALGLGVDMRTVVRSSPRVCLAAGGSLLLLGAISLGLIAALGLA
ncbi:conserved hypothetical integral membrane protein [Arboricoccus pini]|uniref:Conserved hypothetical integral membrane protein n=1 Tax=Arboricoccus pini TaxID=1963835 RepID=A0A212RLG4_9PROT|nr:putative sulfate exporter family transporter [Arboricoccus pini]SNB73307.1 conserved hypothetical integral membrane protein [Arboricoccus pini]